MTRNIYSDDNDDCQSKSDNLEKDANCCLKEDPPKWCPDLSDEAIQANLMNLPVTSEDRSFVDQELAKTDGQSDEKVLEFPAEDGSEVESELESEDGSMPESESEVESMPVSESENLSEPELEPLPFSEELDEDELGDHVGFIFN